MRDYSITKKEGEWYNAKVTDSFGVEHQNWFESSFEAYDWVYYIWAKELPPLTTEEQVTHTLNPSTTRPFGICLLHLHFIYILSVVIRI